MRRVLILATTALACLLCASVASARTRLVADETVPFVSGNVTPKLTLPAGHPVGVRFRDQYMYVTGVEGLTIYDISDPALPKPTGALPLPHFENEDVDLGGNTLLITNDPSEGVGVLYVIDISNPALPKIAGVLGTGFIEDAGINLLIGQSGLDPEPYPLLGRPGDTRLAVD